MDTKSKTCDIYISHSSSDKPIAQRLAEVVRASGLVPYLDLDALRNDEDFETVMREALAESQAVVVVLSSSPLTPWMLVEIGAAQAWSKPIYAVLSDPASVRLPFPLKNVRALPLEGIEEVIHDVKQASAALTEQDRTVLADIYQKTGQPLDQLAEDFGQLHKLTARFEKLSGKSMPRDRLLSEMLRMRKQGIHIRDIHL